MELNEAKIPDNQSVKALHKEDLLKITSDLGWVNTALRKIRHFIFALIIPLIFWSIIITVFKIFGFTIIFRFSLYVLLGLLYASLSFYSAYCYKKTLYYELKKDWYFSKIETTNFDQLILEQKRKDEFYEKYSQYPKNYHDATIVGHMLEGIIAILVAIEFLLSLIP